MKKLSFFIALVLAIGLVSGCNLTPRNLLETKNTGDTREGYILVKGGKIWYKIVGANKKGAPLLVIHGGPGASHDYLEPLAALADERPVVFYDQLGCGNSDNPADKSLWTVERYVEELAQVRKALKLKRVHVLGQSWGTMLAVDYMLTEKKPKGIVSLVLSSPCLSATNFINDQKAYIKRDFTPAAQRMIAKAESSGDYESREYQDIIKLYYGIHLCRLDTWPDCLNRTIAKTNHAIYEYMWGPSEFTMTGTLHNYERVEQLGEIKVPTLFTCGRYDEAAPGTTALYRNSIPGAEVAVFEDASHEHHLEKPEEYINTVRGFLHRAEKTASKRK